MSPAGPTQPSRPREVTFAASQAIVGSAVALIVLVNGMGQLNSAEVNDALADIVATDEAATLDLTLESTRTLLRYSIMALAVLSTASLVMGIFVLRRHRASRVVLTVIGASIALLSLAGGPPGWAVSAYLGLSVALLWTRSARQWFSPGDPQGSPPASGPPPLPPPPPPPPPPPR